MTKQCRTLGSYTRKSGEHYVAVQVTQHYLGRPPAVSYRLERSGQPVFHSNHAQPVVGVLAGLMLEDVR